MPTVQSAIDRSPELERRAEADRNEVLLIAEADPGESIRAYVLALLDGAIQVAVGRALVPESLVHVELVPGASTSGRVLYCNRLEDRYLVGICFEERHRRQTRIEGRYPVAEKKVVVSLLDDPGAVPAEGLVTNVSRSGLGLTVNQALIAGQRVRVDLANSVAFGDVRHCTLQADGSYRAGLSIGSYIRRVDFFRFDGEAVGRPELAAQP